MTQQLLTISQLAKYAGVTTRAVRHYHAVGLLPEPPRDSSRYRRYGADAVIELIRIKTLTDAGVPLTRIKTVAQSNEDMFATNIASIKADITKRIAQLRKTKKRLDTLQSGDRMFVSQAVADYLDYLRQLGLSEALRLNERNAWILISALYPQYVDAWAKSKKEILTQPNLISLYQRLDEARTWDVNDARLRELAKDILRITSKQKAALIVGEDELTKNPQAVSLISDSGSNAFKSWGKLQDFIKELVEKNGPTGSK